MGFRDKTFAAPHPPLVDREAFERAQELIDVLGSDLVRRRTLRSSFILAGHLLCDGCRRRYVGTTANGMGGRYRYYTRYSRARYGPTHCSGPRLRADTVEPAVFDSMVRTFADHRRVRRAIADAADRAEEARPQLREELATTRARISEAERKLDRYFDAFEAGTMPNEACGPRVTALSADIERLRAEAVSLEHDLESGAQEAWSGEDFADLEELVRAKAAIEDLEARRNVIWNLVVDVRVDPSGRCLRPRFRVPSKVVRILSRMVPREGFEPPTYCLEGSCSVL